MSEASWDGNVLNEALRLDPIRERYSKACGTNYSIYVSAERLGG